MKCTLCIAALALAVSAGAQGPPPGTRPGQALTDSQVAESLAVLPQLDALVKAHPRDANAWLRRGTVAWGLSYRGRVGPSYKGLAWQRLGQMADSSIRIALSLGGNDARIQLRAAQFYLSSGQTTMRAQSYPHFARALELARKGKDSALLAEALIEEGRIRWRQYDALANRRLDPGNAFARSLTGRGGTGATPSVGGDPLGGDNTRMAEALSAGSAVPLRLSSVIQRLNQQTQPLTDNTIGEADYTRAERLFQEAVDAAPDDPRAFRQLAMLYIEKRRWKEVMNLTRASLRRNPRNENAWLARGLALQRTHQSSAAAAAFDSGFAVMDPPERAHLTSLKRIIPTQDEAHFAALTQDERARDAQRYWQFADPLWSRGGSDAYTEFLARIAYADIRWTVEELGVRGVDSDRGEMHVRYGPPDVEAVLGPNPVRSDISHGTNPGDDRDDFGAPGAMRPNEILDMTSVTTVWAYNTGWMIIFRGAPTYGTARIPPEDIGTVDSLVRAVPASWKGAVEETIVDMPTQTARFRTSGDSVDLLIATEPPVESLREMTSSNARIRADFWLFGPSIVTPLHDSSAVNTPSARSWKFRMLPGSYAYRIETTADGALLAGRSTDWIDATSDPTSGFSRHGFGLSDLLLVRNASPKPGARRWSDIDIEPTAGTVPKGGQIALVWENYDFGNADGSAKYEISVAIERRYKETLNRIRARVIGVFAAMAGVERTEDRVIIRYDRTVAHAPILLDYLTIGLEDSPPGEYRITLDITDHVTGKTVSREQRFIIQP